MAIVQWVNLEKHSDYAADSDIGSVDRCGKLSIKTAFAKDSVPLSYKVKVSPSGSDNVIYTTAEQIRNSNFKMTKGAIDLGTEAEVVMSDEIKLSAAGGNKYKLEAKDENGKVVKSEEVESKRRLYYQEMTMDDAKGSVPAYGLIPLETHSKKHSIFLKKKGSTKKIPYYKTLTNTNSTAFAQAVKKAYDLSPVLQDVGVAAVFSDYIADSDDFLFKKTLTIGTKHSDVITGATDITLILPQFLWYGLDDADDKVKKWIDFVDIQYIPAKGSPVLYTITAADVEITGPKLRTHGGYHQVKIKHNPKIDKLFKHKSGKLAINAKFYIVASWTNGFSWNPWSDSFKLITVSRRPAWEDMNASTREQVWNHEVGHRFGMVAYGDKLAHDGATISDSQKLPDGPSTFYYDISDNKNYGGHRGPHCNNGATYNDTTDRWSGTPKCVMYGADTIGKAQTPKEYCSKCEPIIRKLDLS